MVAGAGAPGAVRGEPPAVAAALRHVDVLTGGGPRPGGGVAGPPVGLPGVRRPRHRRAAFIRRRAGGQRRRRGGSAMSAIGRAGAKPLFVDPVPESASRVNTSATSPTRVAHAGLLALLGVAALSLLSL